MLQHMLQSKSIKKKLNTSKNYLTHKEHEKLTSDKWTSPIATVKSNQAAIQPTMPKSEKTALWEQCKIGNYEGVAQILQQAATSDIVNAKNIEQYGETALRMACRYSNNINIAKLLLAKGADVNAKTCTYWTPLHRTCGHFDNIDMIRLLLEKGANSDVAHD